MEGCECCPLERVALDILGPLPRSSRGNRYILVVADYFTRWTEAYPIPNQEAITVARRFIGEFVCRYGAPLQILTDQGAQFQSQLFAEMCQLLNIDITMNQYACNVHIVTRQEAAKMI